MSSSKIEAFFIQRGVKPACEVCGANTWSLEHQGNMKGIFPAVSAVQASLGAWLSVIGIVTALVIGIALFNLTRTNAISDQVTAQTIAQSQRLGGVEVRLGAVESRLSVLPQAVAQQLNIQSSPPPSPSPASRRRKP